MSDGFDINWSTVEWPITIRRLLVYAARLLRRRAFAGADVTAEDIVLGAIEKTMSGKRRWNPAVLGLEMHLMGVISSDIYNAVRKQLQTVEMSEALADSLHSDSPSPEEAALQKDELLALMKHLRSKDDRLAEFLSTILLFGTDRPQELSLLLNASPREIYKMKERLRNAVEDFRRVES
jgi:hypothetical protein